MIFFTESASRRTPGGNVRMTDFATLLTETGTLLNDCSGTLDDRRHYEHPLVVPQLPQT